MIPTVTPPKAHAPTVHIAAARRAGAESPSPAAFLDALGSEAADPAVIAERQPDAEAGKDRGKTLPDQPIDSPFAWLATLAQPIAPPVAASPPPATALVTPATLVAEAVVPLSPSPTTPPASIEPLAHLLGPGTLDRFAQDPALVGAHGAIEIEMPATMARRGSASPVAVASFMPSVASVTTGSPVPAGQVFAAALHAAERDKEPPKAGEATTLPAIQASAEVGTHAVQHVGAADGGGTLDMADGRWPRAMMDRIERLRDDANASDTRIRLSPDHLGNIDVALRRDGDTLHVHFRAAEAETRSLLADAQPQLAQLAQQRGLRLGDAAVGGGGSGQPQSRAPQHQSATPHRAPAAVADATITTTDTRVA